MMGDRWDKGTQEYMIRVTPLIDEVIEALEAKFMVFNVTAVQNELAHIYRDHERTFYEHLTWQGWGDAIRGRLTKLGFDLVQLPDHTFGWKKAVPNGAA